MATRDPRTRDRGRAPAREVEVREERPPRGAGGPGTWRDEVVSASGLNVIAGLWLILSPFVLDYESGDAYWNPIVMGAVVATIGIIRAAGALEQGWLSWINMAVGIWLFASAFWLADSAVASWNVGIMGVVVFLLAAWSAGASAERGAAGDRRL